MAANSQDPDLETRSSEPTREYTLKIGSHTWIDGKTYVAGDKDNNKMQLTKAQMERIGVERFEPVSVSTKKDTGAGTTDSIPNPNVEKPPVEKSTAPASSKTKG